MSFSERPFDSESARSLPPPSISPQPARSCMGKVKRWIIKEARCDGVMAHLIAWVWTALIVVGLFYLGFKRAKWHDALLKPSAVTSEFQPSNNSALAPTAAVVIPESHTVTGMSMHMLTPRDDTWETLKTVWPSPPPTLFDTRFMGTPTAKLHPTGTPAQFESVHFPTKSPHDRSFSDYHPPRSLTGLTAIPTGLSGTTSTQTVSSTPTVTKVSPTLSRSRTKRLVENQIPLGNDLAGSPSSTVVSSTASSSPLGSFPTSSKSVQETMPPRTYQWGIERNRDLLRMVPEDYSMWVPSTTVIC